ncbi:MAG: 50S ribosomal protein L10 [Chlamydiia bacterium]|nr:50S ribosomal protein L10 [Chlamydiia bacterium]MCH9615364.1 50S ribosomal protein L10 [Chlamydiia bacterium]MCH9628314.1 50S ribosomal protein L10 [Chlamydiia bacterium]
MRKEKQFLLDQIKSEIDDSNAMVMMSYQNLGPNATFELRDQIRKAGGHMTVVKKRVFVKALEAAGVAVDGVELSGHLAIIYTGEDTVAPTKAVFKFSTENAETLSVLGGHFDGKVATPADVEALSKLPSQDEMRAQFLGILEAPMSQTLAVFEALLTSVPHALENKAEKDS